jgi:hypothetical protein
MSVRILLVVGLFLYACSGNKHEVLTKKQQHDAGECVFRMQVLFTAEEDDFSFPLWFNEKMIVEQKISAITRRIYSLDTKDAERQLREKRQYCFNRNGVVRSVVIRHYFDDEEIGLLRYDYPQGLDKKGFGKFIFVKDTSRLDALQDVNVPEVKVAHYPIYSGAEIFIYRNSSTGRMRHYFPSGKIQKVDSVQVPKLHDEVIMGSAFKPSSRFILGKDEVKSDFTRYVYSKKTGALSRILFYRGPFTTKRTIEYNAEGKCTGFVDVTFHRAKFISSFQSEFTLNGKGNPLKVNTFKIINDKQTVLQSEHFHYEHF